VTIPVSQIVQVNPGVLTAAGNALNLNGLILSQTSDVPVGTVATFATAAAVSAYFGPASTEATMAAIYFAGATNATALPGALLFAQYPTAPVGAYLRGGVLGITLSQLQALTGIITVTIDGVPNTSSSISLSAATSFTNAATIIQAAFTSPNFSVTWNAQHSSFVFTSTTTGALTTASYASGTLSAGLLLTAATGAVISAGAAIATPVAYMNALIQITQNWAAFANTVEPVIADKESFSLWTSQQNNRYLYAGQDSDPNAIISGNTASWGYITEAAAQSGSAPVVGDYTHAAGILSYIASIDFTRQNGASTLAFQNFPSLAASVTSATAAIGAISNSYNFYGAYASSTISIRVV
jgi:hypothetical protein